MADKTETTETTETAFDAIARAVARGACVDCACYLYARDHGGFDVYGPIKDAAVALGLVVNCNVHHAKELA